MVAALGCEDAGIGDIAGFHADGTAGTTGTDFSRVGVATVYGNLGAFENGDVAAAIGLEFDGTAASSPGTLGIVVGTTAAGTA